VGCYVGRDGLELVSADHHRRPVESRSTVTVKKNTLNKMIGKGRIGEGAKARPIGHAKYGTLRKVQMQTYRHEKIRGPQRSAISPSPGQERIL